MNDLTALFQKDEMYGVVGLLSSDDGSRFAVTLWDTRMSRPGVVPVDNYKIAYDAFHQTMANTRDNGWTVIYYGRPNYDC